MPIRKKKNTKNNNLLYKIILLFVVLVICFIFLEIITRILFPDFSPVRENEFKFFQYDSLLGWRNVPGAEGEFKTPDGLTHVKINSLGLRGGETTYDNPYNKTRVMFFGDSHVWGYGVNNSQMFTQLLNNKFNEEDSNIEILNLGVSSYSTDQEYLLLKEEGLKYHPDIVVLAFYANDLGRGLHNYSSGYYKPVLLEDETGQEPYILENVPVPKPNDWIGVRVNPTDSGFFAFAKFFTSKSKFLYFLGKYLYDGTRNFFVRVGLSSENYNLSVDSDEWQNNLFIIGLINDLCLENNITFVLLNFPAKYEIKTGIFYNYDSILKFYAEENDIEYWDMMSETLKEDKKKNLYNLFDSHMNAYGNEFLAGFFYEKLINN